MKKIIYSLIIIVVILSLILIIFRGINGIKQKQSTAQGVLIEDYIELGGIDQYVKIVGQRQDNPVIIFLHGGPGFPINYLSYYFAEHLTDGFTIVLWDQRGCGRTYYQNADAGLTPLAIETMVSDLDDLVGYVMNALDYKEVIIMGQSWGTVLGTCYIEKFPDKVGSYIGIGQVVDFDKGKILAAQTAHAKALDAGMMDEAQTLESSMEQFKASTDIENLDIDNLNTLIVTSLKYLQGENEISGVKQMCLGILSPNFNLRDLKWFLIANDTKRIFELEENLVNYMYFEYNAKQRTSSFEVPMYFLQGDSDWITPTVLAEEYYQSIIAPEKAFLVMPGGHTPFLDNPDVFAIEVKQLLKP